MGCNSQPRHPFRKKNMSAAPVIKQRAFINIAVCVPRCSALYPIAMEEIGCNPNVSMVNKLMMRARMLAGAIS